MSALGVIVLWLSAAAQVAAARLDAWPVQEMSPEEVPAAMELAVRPFGVGAHRARAGALDVAVGVTAADPIVLRARGLRVGVTVGDAVDAPWERAGDALVGRSWSGDTLVVRAQRGVMEDYRIIEAERGPELARYRLDLGEGVRLRHVERVLELLDAEGTPRMRVAAPRAFDAEGAPIELQTRLEGCAADTDPRAPWRRPTTEPGSSSCALVLELPQDARPTYPLLVDPLWTTTETLVAPRAGRGAALAETGLALLVGGVDDSGYLASAELFDEATLTFAVTGSLPEPRAAVAVTSLGATGDALVSGGCTNAPACEPTASALRYDADEGTFREVGPLSSPRVGHGAAERAGVVWIIGGVENDESGQPGLASVDLFEVATETWTAGPALRAGRLTFGLVRGDDASLTVVGGRAAVGGEDLALVDHVAADASSWAALEDLPSPRRGPLLAARSDGRLVVVGGTHLLTPLLSSVVLGSLGWSSSGSLTEEHELGAGFALDNGWLVIAGGDTEAVEAMHLGADVTQASWTSLEPIEHRRRLPAVIDLPSGRVLVAGGRRLPGGGALDTALVWTPAGDGDSCAVGAECASGSCVDGVCCEGPCDGACLACAVSAGGVSDGVCSPLAEGVADPSGACAHEGECGATGVCGAAGTCALASAGAPCSCDALAGACDGDGTCSCAGATCIDDDTAQSADGEAEECAPYRCAAGSCRDACATSTDCVPGAVCDRDRACVWVSSLQTPAAGCTCEAGPRARAAWGWACALFACLAWRARRATRTSSRG